MANSKMNIAEIATNLTNASAEKVAAVEVRDKKKAENAQMRAEFEADVDRLMAEPEAELQPLEAAVMEKDQAVRKCLEEFITALGLQPGTQLDIDGAPAIVGVEQEDEHNARKDTAARKRRRSGRPRSPEANILTQKRRARTMAENQGLSQADTDRLEKQAGDRAAGKAADKRAGMAAEEAAQKARLTGRKE